MSQKHIPTLADLLPLATADAIPLEDYNRNRIIYVFVDRVIDACTFQGRHVSGYRLFKRRTWFSSPLDGDEDITDRTIGVKLYAIKCPTLKKIRKGKEPKHNERYAKRAKEYLEDMVLHRVVRLKLLTKNKNNTATCQVETSKEACCYCLCRKPKKDISHEMAKAGYASLTPQGDNTPPGATITEVYRDILNEMIQNAKAERLGMWELDENILSPEEIRYKNLKHKSMKKLQSIGSGLDSRSSHHNKSNHSRKSSGKRSSSLHINNSSHHLKNSSRHSNMSNSSHHNKSSRHDKRKSKKKMSSGRDHFDDDDDDDDDSNSSHHNKSSRHNKKKSKKKLGSGRDHFDDDDDDDDDSDSSD